MEIMENNENFAEMLEDYLPESNKGDMRKGKVIKKDSEYFYVDLGLKGIGKLKVEEGEVFEIGDEIEVKVISGEDKEGAVRVSRSAMIEKETWDKLTKVFNDKQSIEGKIVKKINGGYIVNILRNECFMPGSQSLINEKDEEQYMNKPMMFSIKTLEDNGKRKKIVVSRRDVRDFEQKALFANVKVGDVVDATVKEVLGFGLSVNMGALSGFIHISEVAWKKIDKLEGVFKAGDVIKAKIIEADEKSRNVKLSIKQTKEDPKANLAAKYKVGDVLDAKIVKIEKFGAFAEVEEGIEGLLHVADLSWTKKVKNVEDFVKVGDIVKVKITDINPETKKIKFGIKQLSVNPWEIAAEKYAVGKKVSGKIVEVKDFGLFVNLEDGIDAFVHVSDVAWSGASTAGFKVGDKLEAEIIELDIENKKIKAGIKQLTENPWVKVIKEYKVGTLVKTTVKKVEDFAIFAEVANGVDGMIHISEASKDYVKKLSDKFKEGDAIEAEIIAIDEDKKRIKLSIKKLEEAEEQAESKELLEKYSKGE